MSTMKKHFLGSNLSIGVSSPSISLSNGVMNLSDSTPESLMNKSIKDIFNMSKLYHKYLSTVKIKITNSNISDTIDIKNFNEFYDNSNIIYEEIKKEWFWLSNGDKMKQFIGRSDSTEIHKQNYYNNFQMLEVIAKMYGFDSWSTAQKIKLSQKSSSIESTFENTHNIPDNLNI